MLARRGARLGLVARGADGLRAAAGEVEDLGGRALVLPADVADASAGKSDVGGRASFHGRLIVI
jgi:short-subunit dehydrogenase